MNLYEEYGIKCRVARLKDRLVGEYRGDIGLNDGD